MKTGPLLKIGRYEMKEEIASGGMATVYRAVQTGHGDVRSVVAVKVLHSHLARKREFQKMFLEEARVGAMLQHRCLLNVLDYGEEEGVSYIVTEYFPSLSLEQLVGKVKKVPLNEALFCLAEAAEALHALHEAKDLEGNKLELVHRDVSPHNVLVGTDGRIKLIDFGIVKRKDPTEQTRTGIVKGKCRYMSPEQAAGKALGQPSDIYSLGIAFLRIVSGVRPHGDGDTGQIMARARTGLDPSKLARRAKLPKEVGELVGRIVAAKPGDRPKSALEVAKEARTLLASYNPSYDVHDFEKWMSTVGQKPRRKRGAKAPAAKPGRPLYTGPGIHPKWVFYGLGTLFLVALLAHLLNQWF